MSQGRLRIAREVDTGVKPHSTYRDLMSFAVFGIYGLNFTRFVSVAGVELMPRFTEPREARTHATSQSTFWLTGVGRIPVAPGRADYHCTTQQLFDLAATLTFLEQQNVVVSAPVEDPHESDLSALMPMFVDRLPLTMARPSHGSLLIDDSTDPDPRFRFLDLCLRKLHATSTPPADAFRGAFFRVAEVWRLSQPFVDMTYYLAFSALESLARSHLGKTDTAPTVIRKYLKSLGFDVAAVHPTEGFRSVGRYVRLRNSLFHNAVRQDTYNENGRLFSLELSEYEPRLLQLVADVVLKELGYTDRYINWDRWIDHQPFNG